MTRSDGRSTGQARGAVSVLFVRVDCVEHLAVHGSRARLLDFGVAGIELRGERERGRQKQHTVSDGGADRSGGGERERPIVIPLVASSPSVFVVSHEVVEPLEQDDLSHEEGGIHNTCTAQHARSSSSTGAHGW